MALKTIRGPENAPILPLLDRTVAVIGFGNQGHAHALNLRDSGINVLVGNRPESPSAQHAIALDFPPKPLGEAVAAADLVIVALPDEVQAEVYDHVIAPHLRPGSIVGLLHGFSIRFGLIKPAKDVGVIMVAPKGPGKTLRDRFVAGQGIPCLFAIHQDSPNRDAQAIGLAWANAIGCARAGIICTTFEAETDTDLFGEQSVLCGGMTSLIVAAFETLVEAGYPPELAYLECCHEVKQISDLVYERGLAGMMEKISNTAEFGAYREGPLIIDAAVREHMRTTLDRIRSGEFARELRDDHARGFEWFLQQREQLRNHPIESSGEFIRSLMPWLNQQRTTNSL
jgi:ketol-acid reductoisomerase